MERRKRIAVWLFSFILLGLIILTYVKRSSWEEPPETVPAAQKLNP